MVPLHGSVYCVTLNASIRLHKQNFKIHDVKVLRKLAGLFSHMLFDIVRELCLLQLY